MDRLKQARHYARSGRMAQSLLAYLGLVIGMDLILIGHVPPLMGIAASLERLFFIPPEIHGAMIAFVSIALAYAAAKRFRAMAAVLLVACVGFYMLAATAAFFALRTPVAFACGTAAGASAWQVFVVMWGGRNVDRSSHHDISIGGIGSNGGVDSARRIERYKPLDTPGK